MTLIEMIVVIALLGLILGISGLALASLREPRGSARARALTEARAQAIRSGEPVRVDLAPPDSTDAPSSVPVVFLPDGRALGTYVDAITGAPRDAAP